MILIRLRSASMSFEDFLASTVLPLFHSKLQIRKLVPYLGRGSKRPPAVSIILMMSSLFMPRWPVIENDLPLRELDGSITRATCPRSENSVCFATFVASTDRYNRSCLVYALHKLSNNKPLLVLFVMELECQNCHNKFTPKNKHSAHQKWCTKECKLAPRSTPTEKRKQCNKCKKIKLAQDFYIRKNGYMSDLCKVCFRGRRTIYINVFRKEKLPQRVELMKSVLAEFKSKPCMDCKKSFPSYCMDTDHRDPNSKTASMGDLVRKCSSVEQFKKELEKCDVVCATCHRIRTHEKDHYNVRPKRIYQKRTRAILRLKKS